MCGIDDYCHPGRESQPAEYNNGCVGQEAPRFLHFERKMWAIPVRPDRLGFALECYREQVEKRDMLKAIVANVSAAGSKSSSAKAIAANVSAAGSKRPRDSTEDDEASRPVKKRMGEDGNVICLPQEIEDLIIDYVDEDKDDDEVTTAEKRWLQGYLCSQGAHEECQLVTDQAREEAADAFDEMFGLCPAECGDPWPWEQEGDDWDSTSEFSRKAPYDANDGGWDKDIDLPTIDRDGSQDGRRRARRERRNEWEAYKQKEMIEDVETSELLTERGGGTRRNDGDWIERITTWIQGAEEFDNHDDWDEVEAHQEILDDWKELFKAEGEFDKLREFLKAHFGLDVFLTQGEVNEHNRAKFEVYHCQAFLFDPDIAYSDCESDVEDNYDSDAESLTASENAVGPSDPCHDIQVLSMEHLEELSEERKSRFDRALRYLKLEPDIHPACSSEEVNSDMWKTSPHQLLPIRIFEKIGTARDS